MLAEIEALERECRKRLRKGPDGGAGVSLGALGQVDVYVNVI